MQWYFFVASLFYLSTLLEWGMKDIHTTAWTNIVSFLTIHFIISFYF